MYKVTTFPFTEDRELENFEQVCQFTSSFCINNSIHMPTSDWMKQKLETSGRCKVQNAMSYMVIQDPNFKVGVPKVIPEVVKPKRKRKAKK